MPTARSLLGRRAEDVAVAELARRGYEIVERNYRCRYGEVDIAARDGDTLVFIEVRSRRSNDPAWPSESIGERKQTKLVLTAQHYLAARQIPAGLPCRFDVVEVCFQRGKPISVEVIRNAFGEM